MDCHEGVTCDSCFKSNFPGRRFKCLICYDFDMCSTCYDKGVSKCHPLDHPMQCIIPPAHYGIFYGGESSSNADTPQSYVCPYCGEIGFSDNDYHEHIDVEHANQDLEVICPICAASRRGEPNLVTKDLGTHLSDEHNMGDFQSLLDNVAAFHRHFSRRNLMNANGIFTRIPPAFNASNALLSDPSYLDPYFVLQSQLAEFRRPSGLVMSGTHRETADSSITIRPLPRRSQQNGVSSRNSYAHSSSSSILSIDSVTVSPSFLSVSSPLAVEQPLRTNQNANSHNGIGAVTEEETNEAIHLVGDKNHSSLAMAIANGITNTSMVLSDLPATTYIPSGGSFPGTNRSLLIPFLSQLASQRSVQDFEVRQDRYFFFMELILASMRVPMQQRSDILKPPTTANHEAHTYEYADALQHLEMLEMPDEAEVNLESCIKYTTGYSETERLCYPGDNTLYTSQDIIDIFPSNADAGTDYEYTSDDSSSDYSSESEPAMCEY